MSKVFNRLCRVGPFRTPDAVAYCGLVLHVHHQGVTLTRGPRLRSLACLGADEDSSLEREGLARVTSMAWKTQVVVRQEALCL
jgi:hypothetical protein